MTLIQINSPEELSVLQTAIRCRLNFLGDVLHDEIQEMTNEYTLETVNEMTHLSTLSGRLEQSQVK